VNRHISELSLQTSTELSRKKSFNREDTGSVTCAVTTLTTGSEKENWRGAIASGLKRMPSQGSQEDLEETPVAASGLKANADGRIAAAAGPSLGAPNDSQPASQSLDLVSRSLAKDKACPSIVTGEAPAQLTRGLRAPLGQGFESGGPTHKAPELEVEGAAKTGTTLPPLPLPPAAVAAGSTAKPWLPKVSVEGVEDTTDV
jgi:hypothetical protein